MGSAPRGYRIQTRQDNRDSLDKVQSILKNTWAIKKDNAPKWPNNLGDPLVPVLSVQYICIRVHSCFYCQQVDEKSAKRSSQASKRTRRAARLISLMYRKIYELFFDQHPGRIKVKMKWEPKKPTSILCESPCKSELLIKALPIAESFRVVRGIKVCRASEVYWNQRGLGTDCHPPPPPPRRWGGGG